MKPVPIILLIIFILAIFTVGGGLGIMYEKNKGRYDVAEINKSLDVINSSFKIVSPVSAVGTVTKISGRVITISNSDQKIDVLVPEDAKIYSVQGEQINPVQATPVQADFDSITLQKFISAILTVSPFGKLETRSIVVLPDISL